MIHCWLNILSELEVNERFVQGFVSLQTLIGLDVSRKGSVVVFLMWLEGLHVLHEILLLKT